MLILGLSLNLSVTWLVMLIISIYRNRTYFPSYFPPLSKADHWVVPELHSLMLPGEYEA